MESKYKPRMVVLGLDVGIKNLLSTSEGDLLGQTFMARLVKFDRQISTRTANRRRIGLKARSARYDRLVERMRARCGWPSCATAPKW
ncbi:hypothetical protein [Cupriavidus basilensis]|uniref:hypothetical protein n=1 Tax=Cupriavidus basilensis TaxID=68895 RepID=UPI0023E8C317|nr:hypothetical protein [Cupriavidus basilensis]MDF3884519.1 hypothetical protein [Cupriavidus basilensis]